MKRIIYEITEHQFDSAIFQFIDIITSDFDQIFDDDYNRFVLAVPNEPYAILVYDGENMLYINTNLAYQVMQFFSISRLDAGKSICRWFSKKYNVPVKDFLYVSGNTSSLLRKYPIFTKRR
jgi:hypothetical protein